jgi:hypothetical protein
MNGYAQDMDAGRPAQGFVAGWSPSRCPTEDSVIARFTFTRGADGRFTATRAVAVLVRIDLDADAVRVVPADAATVDWVAAVLDRRGRSQTGWRSSQGRAALVTDGSRLHAASGCALAGEPAVSRPSWWNCLSPPRPAGGRCPAR